MTKDNKDDVVHKPHDKFVFKMLENGEVAKHFMQTYLPDDVLAYLDLDTLELSGTHFINFLNEESHADIVFQVNFQDKEAYILILLEHQSRIDKAMPFRILWYTLQLYERHINSTGQHTVPFVYPLVLYHHLKPWEFSTDIRDYIDAPKQLIERYFLKAFQLIDLSTISDAQIKKDPWVAAINLPLKHIFSSKMDNFIDSFEAVLHFFEQEIRTKYPETGEYILSYLAKNARIKDMATALGLVKTKFGEEIGDKFVTLGQQLEKQGFKKGIQKGIEQGKEYTMRTLATNLNARGISPAEIASLMNISETKVKTLIAKSAKEISIN